MRLRLDSKHTKIVATIGPASRDPEILRAMIRAGMNVARINFSHGDHQTHGETIDDIRRLAAEEDTVVAVLCDIQGPKIRIGELRQEPMMLEIGDRITLTLEQIVGGKGIVSLPHPEFLRDIEAGATLLLDDGNLQFSVHETDGSNLVCDVVVGGPLKSRKGVSAPNARLTLSAITDKDRKDIQFALAKDCDYMAMSFVRSAADIRELQSLMRQFGRRAAVIAKIEMGEALENIEEIISVCDGIMVARGDLGIETPAEEVPFHQKRIIKLCNFAAKPVITATQMLESMTENPRPTRAEASDVYNAILDGTDAIMLSAESASGAYPVRAVEVMSEIATIAEQNIAYQSAAPADNADSGVIRADISDAISKATTAISQALSPTAIVTTTMSGNTTRRVAKERPGTPILCMTPSTTTQRRMALVWGVTSLQVQEFTTIDEMISIIVRTAHEKRLVERGDRLVIIAGVPFGIDAQTNLVKIHTVGEEGEI
ncbi:MAG: pyruvate kinase [Chloroflexota bacterium]|nr:pyruvate kinase [Chloroflexota bacterium]MDE2946367.1 pyruvate kinase [Chloroflexota bacterium]